MGGKGSGKILIVDDEPNALKVLGAILTEDGYQIFQASDYDEALKCLHKESCDAVITDTKMPGRDGLELFDYINKKFPDIPVIFLTAYGTVDSAVHAITLGAFYYFVKPPDYVKLKGILARAVEQRSLKRELETLKMQLAGGKKTERLIGTTPELARIQEIVESIKDSACSVLITGETGTGKELIARSLHFGSIRSVAPFVAVNCAAIPRDLIESELFGYERGAFSGALNRRIGRFEEAAEGSLFLDEVGELELSIQAKLLRVLQEKEIERLGSNKKISVNFRLISSTNRDLRNEVLRGNFRDDLFYRLNVLHIHMPPLRERKDDIPLLVTEFAREFCIKEQKALSVSHEVMEIFRQYQWPGNIRQLRNILERAVVLAKGRTITVRDLPDDLLSQGFFEVSVNNDVTPLRELTSQAVRTALEKCQGNKSKAAELLKISRKSLYKWLQG